MSNIFLAAGARLARYIRSEPIRHMVVQASDDLKTGSHLLLFPEGTRTTQQPINTLKASIALIAMRAQVPVQTVLIETNSAFLSKGWPLFKKPLMPICYKVRLGKRFDPPQNAHHFMVELERYFSTVLVATASCAAAVDATDKPVAGLAVTVSRISPAQGELFPSTKQNTDLPRLNTDGTPS